MHIIQFLTAPAVILLFLLSPIRNRHDKYNSYKRVSGNTRRDGVLQSSKPSLDQPRVRRRYNSPGSTHPYPLLAVIYICREGEKASDVVRHDETASGVIVRDTIIYVRYYP